MFHVLCANTWQPSRSKTWKMKKKEKEKKMQMLHLQSKGWANCVHLQFESDFSPFVLELGEYLKNVSRQVHHLDLFYDHSNIITAKWQTGFCQLVEEYILFPRNRRLPDCCRQVSMSVCNLRTYSLKPPWSPWMSNIQNGRQIDIMLIVVTCRQNLNGSLEQ